VTGYVGYRIDRNYIAWFVVRILHFVHVVIVISNGIKSELSDYRISCFPHRVLAMYMYLFSRRLQAL
jgi:hypothetical protein